MNLKDSFINFFRSKNTQDNGVSKISGAGFETYSAGIGN